MDLLRVGILPVPERMATKQGAELVANPNYSDDYDLYVEQAKRGDIQWESELRDMRDFCRKVW